MKEIKPKVHPIRLVFDQKTIEAIHEFIGKHPAERGGMLGSDPDGTIRHFAKDTTARCTAGAYDPDIEEMNRQIKAWKAAGTRFQGFVHSHPPGFRELSFPDKHYAVRILGAFQNLEWLALPLVMTEPDSGKFKILPFVAIPDPKNRKNVSFSEVSLMIEKPIPTSKKADTKSRKRRKKKKAKQARVAKFHLNAVLLRKLALQLKIGASALAKRQPATRGLRSGLRYYGRFPLWWKTTSVALAEEKLLIAPVVGMTLQDRLRERDAAYQDELKATQYLDRVQTAYDVHLLNETRLVVIGLGGAAGLLRGCARAGFGEFVLYDFDTLSASNIGTQSADPEKIGVPKVDALAEDIRILNPRAAVVAVQEKIENISDEAFEMLCIGPLRGDLHTKYVKGGGDPFTLNPPLFPKSVVLLVLTDNFQAQSRGHRLGLQFGLPTICAQEYKEGRGAEVTFTVPGITPACHRCVTSSRYQAYLAEGYRNTVTSHGAPIFAAEMLNSVLGHILLAVAHYGSAHPRFGDLVTRMGNRNLVLMRMDPDLDAFFGRPVFSRRLAGASEPGAFFMLDALFVAQDPDCGQSPKRPICPDCGGRGNLRLCIGSFQDTRLMRSGSGEHENAT